MSTNERIYGASLTPLSLFNAGYFTNSTENITLWTCHSHLQSHSHHTYNTNQVERQNNRQKPPQRTGPFLIKTWKFPCLRNGLWRRRARSRQLLRPVIWRHRPVPTEPATDGPFTGPSTATGPFRRVTGPVGTGLKATALTKPRLISLDHRTKHRWVNKFDPGRRRRIYDPAYMSKYKWKIRTDKFYKRNKQEF